MVAHYRWCCRGQAGVAMCCHLTLRMGSWLWPCKSEVSRAEAMWETIQKEWYENADHFSSMSEIVRFEAYHFLSMSQIVRFGPYHCLIIFDHFTTYVCHSFGLQFSKRSRRSKVRPDFDHVNLVASSRDAMGWPFKMSGAKTSTIFLACPTHSRFDDHHLLTILSRACNRALDHAVSSARRLDQTVSQSVSQSASQSFMQFLMGHAIRQPASQSASQFNDSGSLSDSHPDMHAVTSPVSGYLRSTQLLGIWSAQMCVYFQISGLLYCSALLCRWWVLVLIVLL